MFFPEAITTEYIVSQVIGLVVLVLTCVSFFFKKDKLMIITAVANIILAVSYFFLNTPAAAVGTIVAIIRCVVFYFCEKKYKRIPRSIFCLSILLFTASTLMFWTSPYDLFEYGVLVSFTAALILKEEWQVRSLLLVNKVLGLVYNLLIFNYVGVLCKVIELIVVIVTLIKFYKLKKKELVSCE